MSKVSGTNYTENEGKVRGDESKKGAIGRLLRKKYRESDRTALEISDFFFFNKINMAKFKSLTFNITIMQKIKIRITVTTTIRSALLFTLL